MTPASEDVELAVEMILTLLWIFVLFFVLFDELILNSPEGELVPRCLRCDGMRERGHRCPDAEGVEGVDRLVDFL